MRRWMVLILLVATVAVVAGRVLWRELEGVRVTTVEVVRGRVVSAVYATGRVDTDRRATLRARVTAPLDALRVNEGVPVEAGELVGRQDCASLRLERERAEREVEAARAALAQARDTAERTGHLVREGLAPEDEGVRAAERARELEAQALALSSGLGLTREQESWCALRAPLAGVVSAVLHRPGDPLREGDEILTVVDLAPAYVRVAVDERDVGRVGVGQEVRMALDAYPSRLLHGQVLRIVPALDRLTKSSDVLVSLPAERPALQLDLTVTANIVTGIVDGVAVLPRDALAGSGTRRTAFVVHEGRARAVPVTIGPCDEERCQVTAGVAEGDRVISPLPSGLGEGDRVTPT